MEVREMPAIGSINATELQAHRDAGKIECSKCHQLVVGYSMRDGKPVCMDCRRGIDERDIRPVQS